MFEAPKLVFLLLVGFAVWYALRWLNRLPSRPGQRQQAPPPRPRQAAIEDLVACRQCGTYVAAGAGCGKPGCPQPH
ncbi:MAG TPA: hypothetical protein VKQ73_10520 [Stellaceae bacterium]|nr:hypothetical protein [Stellaceae bacterium]